MAAQDERLSELNWAVGLLATFAEHNAAPPNVLAAALEAQAIVSELIDERLAS